MNLISHSSRVDSFTWCSVLKNICLPAAISITMCKLFNCFFAKCKRAELHGKVVVITGASSGLGEALAHVFYENGCKIVLAARRKLELERVRDDLLKKNVPIATLAPIVLELDLSEIEQIDSFVQKVYNACGHIDILINNAGVSHRGFILDTKIEVDRKIMAINYFGTVELTKACLPKMVERKSGHIVFMSSVQGLIAIPHRSAYAASKHAMQAFADSLRSEMHHHNINVTVVSPGYVKTAISLNAYSGSGEAHGEMDASTAAGYSPEYVASKLINAISCKEKEIIISQFLPRLAIFMRHCTPSLYFWIMAKRAANNTP